MADMNKVLCNVQQILTPAQQLQARKNIGAFASSNAAPEYDPAATYPIIGILRMHEGVLYRNKVAINTAEDWTEAHWENVNLAGMLNADLTDWLDITDEFTFDDTYFTNKNNFKIFYNLTLQMVAANVVFQSKNLSTGQSAWKYIATASLRTTLGIGISTELIAFSPDPGTNRVNVGIDSEGIKYKNPSTNSDIWYCSPGGMVLMIATPVIPNSVS